MARKSPEQQVQRIRQTLSGWEEHGRQTTLSSYSLTEFKAEMQPALDAHDRVLEQRKQLRISIIQRNTAVAKAMESVYLVDFSARGHPDHGRDSALCEALGLTRESVRRAKIRRGRRRNRARSESRTSKRAK
jgi:hypothetical protein